MFERLSRRLGCLLPAPPAYAVQLLVRKDILARTHGTVLGGIWLLVQPLFLMLLYTAVFGFVLQVRFGTSADPMDYAIYLMAGLMPFAAFQESLLRASGVLTEQRALFERAQFPPVLLPVIPTIASILTEVLGLLVVAIAVAWIMGTVSPWLVLIPLLVIIRVMWTLGLAWIVSVATVFVRDLAMALNLFLMALMFATPILYPIEMVPDGLRWIFEINPLYYLVELYRGAIITGEPPGISLLWLVVGGGLMMLLGRAFFRLTISRAKDFL